MFNNPPLLVEEVYCPRCSQLVDTLLFAYYILLLYYYNSNRTSVAIYIYIYKISFDYLLYVQEYPLPPHLQLL